MLRILKVHIYVTNAYLLLSYAYEKCLFIMIEINILWMETALVMIGKTCTLFSIRQGFGLIQVRGVKLQVGELVGFL